MKSLTIVGVILLVIALVLFYLNTDTFSLSALQSSHFTGIMGGIGVGLFIGGMVGYLSKGKAIRKQQRQEEIQRLKLEKEDLEKQIGINNHPESRI